MLYIKIKLQWKREGDGDVSKKKIMVENEGKMLRLLRELEKKQWRGFC